MLIEHRLPLTSMRADVVLAGVDARTGGDRYVVVERYCEYIASSLSEHPDSVLNLTPDQAL
jgi:hypothetical protein